jgi:hypothetical protein
MYLGTIASHKTNPITEEEDYVLFQIDIPPIQLKSAPLDIPIYKHVPITYIPEPIESFPEPIVSLPEPIVSLPEPIVSKPKPIEKPEPKSKKAKSETRLDNSYQSSMSYFW